MKTLDVSVLALAALCSLPACNTVPEPTRTVSANAQNIIGSWELVKVGRTAAPEAISLVFGENRMLAGAIVRNRWSGTYDLIGASADFSDNIIITSAGCGPTFFDKWEVVERAKQSFWRHEALYLSADLQRLYMAGDDILTFKRVETLRALPSPQ